eukprot:15440397-Alexandrium_andersonii.AAC.1
MINWPLRSLQLTTTAPLLTQIADMLSDDGLLRIQVLCEALAEPMLLLIMLGLTSSTLPLGAFTW